MAVNCVFVWRRGKHAAETKIFNPVGLAVCQQADPSASRALTTVFYYHGRLTLSWEFRKTIFGHHFLTYVEMIRKNYKISQFLTWFNLLWVVLVLHCLRRYGRELHTFLAASPSFCYSSFLLRYLSFIILLLFRLGPLKPTLNNLLLHLSKSLFFSRRLWGCRFLFCAFFVPKCLSEYSHIDDLLTLLIRFWKTFSLLSSILTTFLS